MFTLARPRVTIIAAALLLAAVPALAQRPTQTIPDFSRAPDSDAGRTRWQPFDKKPLDFSTTVHYVLVPVVVTDKNGKAVPGLTKEAFRITENGKEQKVASVDEITSDTKAVVAPRLQDNKFSNETTTEGGAKRITVIALDLINTPYLDQTRARQAVVKYLADSVNENSLFQLVVIESSGVRVIHDFTQDTKELVAALQRVKSRLTNNTTVDAALSNQNRSDNGPTTAKYSSYDPGTGLTDVEGAQLAVLAGLTPAAATNAQQAAVGGTLEAFSWIAGRLAGIPGRKSLVWVTGGFPFSVDAESGAISEGVSFESYQRTMQMLSNSNTALYPVDARGLMTAQPDASAHLSRRDNQEVAKLTQTNSDELRQTLDTMRAFADLTGGRAYVNTNDMPTAIRDAVNDSVSYYMLSYAMDKSNRRPGWRKIGVKVVNGGYNVRSRQGYFVTQTTIDPKNSQALDINNALSSPLDFTALPLRATFDPAIVSGANRKVTFAMMVPGGAADVDTSNNNRFSVELGYVVRNMTGQEVARQGKTYNLNLTPEMLQQVQSHGLGYSDALELPPGKYSVSMVVRDNVSGRVGSVHAPLDLK